MAVPDSSEPRLQRLSRRRRKAQRRPRWIGKMSVFQACPVNAATRAEVGSDVPRHITNFGDDEHAAVRRCCRGGSYQHTAQNCGETSHDAPGNKGSPAFDKPESLKMINLGLVPQTGCSEALTQSPRLAHGSRDERFPRHLW